MLMLLKSSEILVKVRCEANNIHPFRACNEHGQHFYFFLLRSSYQQSTVDAI